MADPIVEGIVRKMYGPDPEPPAPNTIWLIFGFAAFDDPDEPTVCTSFRIHIGPLTPKVMRQVVTSMRREVKTRGLPLSWIEARPHRNQPTPHGHQRWPNALYGYEETLWASRDYKRWLRSSHAAWEENEDGARFDYMSAP